VANTSSTVLALCLAGASCCLAIDLSASVVPLVENERIPLKANKLASFSLFLAYNEISFFNESQRS
jgi:hypothetical protein